MQRTDAIAKVKQSRAAWDILLASVPDDLYEVPVRTDGSTLKSIIAHVDFYEWWTGEFFRLRTWPEVDPRLNTPDVDTRNQALDDINRDRPLAEVLAESPQLHAHLVDALESMSDDDFLNAELLGQGTDVAWSPLAMAASSTWDHYDEHAPDIRAWLDTHS